MWPATARIVAAARIGRVQRLHRPGLDAARRAAAAGRRWPASVAEALPQSATAASRSHSGPWCVFGAAGQLDRRRQQHRLQRRAVRRRLGQAQRARSLTVGTVPASRL